MSNNNQGRSKRRRRAGVSWKDLPSFCDASASVSAATFGARRLPEIKSLWAHSSFHQSHDREYRTGASLASGGGKTSSRHLRRRATSHASRKRHRYPDESNNNAAPEPPVVKTDVIERRPSRRQRRKHRRLMQAEHECWRHPVTSSVVGETKGETRSNNKVRWMKTHLWHTKRFKMESLWGWKVPMVHCNRGAKAALRLVREGKCLLQDATWSMQPIWLEVPNSSTRDLAKELARIIPGFSDFSERSSNLAGESGEGILYQVDSFPKGAVGPVSWLSTRTPLSEAERSENGDDKFIVYFWAHPSIRPLLFQCLLQLVNRKEGFCRGPYYDVSVDGGGLAFLRLRGRSVIKCLKAALTTFDVVPSTSLDTMTDDSLFEKGLSLGKALSISISQKDEKETSRLVLLRQCPRNPSLDCNRAVSGLDLICNPRIVRQLFLDLVVHGGACPIGIVEEAHLYLDSSPPLPVFPRDYPDTEQGHSYWTGRSEEWTVVRKYLEGGTGRIRKARSAPSKILWTDLVEKLTNVSETALVMVRGEFGKPFCTALSSSCYLPSKATATLRHRNRRRNRSPRELTQAPMLSKEDKEKHQEFCESLSQSLSLPALILCHLTIAGKGTVRHGAVLRSSGAPDKTLGIVTTGSFSPARGCCHGLAICGAARFLEALAASGLDRSSVIFRRLDREKEVQLRVLVGDDGEVKREGSISLLL